MVSAGMPTARLRAGSGIACCCRKPACRRGCRDSGRRAARGGCGPGRWFAASEGTAARACFEAADRLAGFQRIRLARLGAPGGELGRFLAGLDGAVEHFQRRFVHAELGVGDADFRGERGLDGVEILLAGTDLRGGGLDGAAAFPEKIRFPRGVESGGSSSSSNPCRIRRARWCWCRRTWCPARMEESRRPRHSGGHATRGRGPMPTPCPGCFCRASEMMRVSVGSSKRLHQRERSRDGRGDREIRRVFPIGGQGELRVGEAGNRATTAQPNEGQAGNEKRTGEIHNKTERRNQRHERTMRPRPAKIR